jgi:YidC/Oxa1 family membrane protein insertase
MKELQPRLEELKKKFGSDKEKFAMAQMQLWREHKINPMSGCLPLFVQFPVFTGLWMALNSSVDLRRAPFLYIRNLAAPDALFHLPFVVPYLGWTDFNLLPFFTVALFVVQQKMFMPPPTDEQQEMQQKMMKYMMIVMGLMFYKVASGLCIYFIASSLWGFAERKLLPKKKAAPPTDAGTTPATSASLLSRVIGGPSADSGTTAVTAVAPAKGKGRRRGKDRGGVQREAPDDGRSTFQRMRRWLRRKREGLSEWWAEVLKQARKK